MLRKEIEAEQADLADLKQVKVAAGKNNILSADTLLDTTETAYKTQLWLGDESAGPFMRTSESRGVAGRGRRFRVTACGVASRDGEDASV